MNPRNQNVAAEFAGVLADEFSCLTEQHCR